MGERSIEKFLRTNLPAISFFRKVAIVEEFYGIIKCSHVDEKGVHAGQKKTYRLVRNFYFYYYLLLFFCVYPSHLYIWSYGVSICIFPVLVIISWAPAFCTFFNKSCNHRFLSLVNFQMTLLFLKEKFGILIYLLFFHLGFLDDNTYYKTLGV